MSDSTNNGTTYYLGTDGVPRVVIGGRAPFSQTVNEMGQVLFGQSVPGNVRITNDTIPVKVSGTKVSQQLTEENAVNNVLSFSKLIDTIELYNTDLENDGVFIVNGISIKVPKGQAFKASIGGTPKPTVMIQGSTSYIVTTYE